MNASRRFIVWGTIPLGSLVGGVLASTIGLAADPLGRRGRGLPLLRPDRCSRRCGRCATMPTSRSPTLRLRAAA